MVNELVLIIALALVFDFLNGIHDSSNIVATMISSRAFRPQVALLMTAAAEFTGPFLFGVAVARTIGEGVVEANTLTLNVILAALLGAIAWNLLTWFFGFPSSSTHALVGGLVGAVAAGSGLGAIKLKGLGEVLIALFASPIVGFLVGFVIMRVLYFLLRGATPRVNEFFKRAQLLTALGMAFSHGTNDAQKTMGVIALSLLVGGALPVFRVPLWVIAASAGAISLGTAFGGWRLIRTLGGRFYKIRPIHSFSSQLSSGIVILAASWLGGPVSTTQVVSSSIIGVGSAERWSKVRWSVAGDILTAWFITLPVTAAISASLYWLIQLI